MRYSTTIMAVTDCADAHSAPATVVADLGRSAGDANRVSSPRTNFIYFERLVRRLSRSQSIRESIIDRHMPKNARGMEGVGSTFLRICKKDITYRNRRCRHRGSHLQTLP